MVRIFSVLAAVALVAAVAPHAPGGAVLPTGEGGGGSLNTVHFTGNATTPQFTTISYTGTAPTITQSAGNATNVTGPTGIQISPFNYTVSGSGSFDISWTSTRQFTVNTTSTLSDAINGIITNVFSTGGDIGTAQLTISAYAQQNGGITTFTDGPALIVGNPQLALTTAALNFSLNGITVTPGKNQQGQQENFPFEYTGSATAPNAASAGPTYTYYFTSELKYTETNAGTGINAGKYIILIDPQPFQPGYNGSLTGAAATPEPCSLVLAGLGGLGLAGVAWRRRRMAAV